MLEYQELLEKRANYLQKTPHKFELCFCNGDACFNICSNMPEKFLLAVFGLMSKRILTKRFQKFVSFFHIIPDHPMLSNTVWMFWKNQKKKCLLGAEQEIYRLKKIQQTLLSIWINFSTAVLSEVQTFSCYRFWKEIFGNFSIGIKNKLLNTFAKDETLSICW